MSERCTLFTAQQRADLNVLVNQGVPIERLATGLALMDVTRRWKELHPA